MTDDREVVALLVQAKKMSGHFARARYVQLGHEYPSAELQIDRLIRSSRSGFPKSPTYVLYNGSLAVDGDLFEPDRCQNPAVPTPARGCSIASAAAIRHSAFGDDGEIRSTLVADIARLSLPWECLFCCERQRGSSVRRVAAALGELGVATQPLPFPDAPAYVHRMRQRLVDPAIGPVEADDAPDAQRPGSGRVALLVVGRASPGNL